MAENIQLQQVMVNLVIIEMRGDRLIVCRRMLHRREGIDVLAVGKHDNAARMLTGRLPDVRHTDGKTLNLRTSPVLILLLEILLHIAVSSFGSKACHGSRTEGLSRAEDHLRVFVRLGLIPLRNSGQYPAPCFP